MISFNSILLCIVRIYGLGFWVKLKGSSRVESSHSTRPFPSLSMQLIIIIIVASSFVWPFPPSAQWHHMSIGLNNAITYLSGAPGFGILSQP